MYSTEELAKMSPHNLLNLLEISIEELQKVSQNEEDEKSKVTIMEQVRNEVLRRLTT